MGKRTEAKFADIERQITAANAQADHWRAERDALRLMAQATSNPPPPLKLSHDPYDDEGAW